MIQGLDYRFFTASDRRSRRKAWLCTATLIVTLGAILLAFSGCVSAYVRQQERTVATRQSAVRIGPDGLIPTVSGDSISPAQIRAKMKRRLEAIGYQPDPEKRGTLQDLSSDRRTNLIIETQTAMARGYGDWRSQQNPTILDVYPASELYRAIPRKVHAGT